MSELGDRLVANARLKIDAPFQHHFKPENICSGGKVTLDQCMERGMDASGYDCSGLVIASLCAVISTPPRDWPRDLRHTQQLAPLAEDKDCEPGDIRMFFAENGHIHIGIASSPTETIHASGISGRVEEGIVLPFNSDFVAIRALSAHTLRDAAFDRPTGF